eukprot:3526042-Amphidinium_carterae.1
MLEWCTEEWRSATAFRRQYSLQSWHSWYIASLPDDWHFHELCRAREDPWAGTLVPRLLAALAAGCRGQLVETAKANLNLVEWLQIGHALWEEIVPYPWTRRSIESINLNVVEVLLEAGADPNMT